MQLKENEFCVPVLVLFSPSKIKKKKHEEEQLWITYLEERLKSKGRIPLVNEQKSPSLDVFLNSYFWNI